MSPLCSGSSRPGIPAERDRQTIRDLHVAIKRRNPLKGAKLPIGSDIVVNS
jgi:hypothetical protein